MPWLTPDASARSRTCEGPGAATAPVRSSTRRGPTNHSSRPPSSVRKTTPDDDALLGALDARVLESDGAAQIADADGPDGGDRRRAEEARDDLDRRFVGQAMTQERAEDAPASLDEQRLDAPIADDRERLVERHPPVVPCRHELDPRPRIDQARPRLRARAIADADHQRPRAAAEDARVRGDLEATGQDDAPRLAAARFADGEARVVDLHRGAAHEDGVVLGAGAVRELEAAPGAQRRPNADQSNPAVERLGEVKSDARARGVHGLKDTEERVTNRAPDQALSAQAMT